MNCYGDEYRLRSETLAQAIKRRLQETRERAAVRQLGEDQRKLTAAMARQDWIDAMRGMSGALTRAQAKALNEADIVTARELRLRGMMPLGY